VKSALKKTQAHPKDPNAGTTSRPPTDRREADRGERGAGARAQLKPNDIGALQRVAGFYETKAADKETEAQNLQAQAPLSLAGVLGVSSASPIGQALSNDPTSQQLTQKAQAASRRQTPRSRRTTGLYKRMRSCSRTTSTPNSTTRSSPISPAIQPRLSRLTSRWSSWRRPTERQQAKQRIAVLSLAKPR